MVEVDHIDSSSPSLVNHDDSKSPGYHFISNFQSMHDLIEKLILLKYDKEFCPVYKCQPLHRYYFTIQTNPGEQFYVFSCLSVWLIKEKCQLKMTSELNPQDYEDPNVTIHGILDAVRLIVDKVSIAPNKIKQGYGSEVIWILNTLTDDALSKNQFARSPIVVKVLTSDKDYELDNIEEDKIIEDEDDIEINFNDQFTLLDDEYGDFDNEMVTDKLYTQSLVNRPQAILASNVDSAEWKIEVERVLPQLKVILRSSDHKADWRAHIEEMYRHRNEVEKHFETTSNSLKKLSDEINKEMAQIGAREKYLQLQLETLTSEYNSLEAHLKQATESYKMVSGGVTEKSRKLASISEELDSVKEEMEKRGTAMTDGTPLISIRKALTTIKQEIVSLDIRIGVAMHTLLRIKVADSTKDALEKQQPFKNNRMDELIF
ncbi:intraflagellar transport protein 57 homolog [Tetranychus urticae]|uniref:Intraflagellar transport protein 57 homolog n=1 Tax=Tetranychus urticae TaxID=32264 RepID=T1KGV9_TETUR|nr:intraflagellar transport protein 57 homolog [Tetranychus urticae]